MNSKANRHASRGFSPMSIPFNDPINAMTWISRHQFKPVVPAKISPTADGIEFEFGQEGAHEQVFWSGITAVLFEKVDLYTVDSIVCFLIFQEESKLKAIIFDEEDDGFYDATSAFEENLPAFDRRWWSKVAFPPFELCRHQAFPYSESGEFGA